MKLVISQQSEIGKGEKVEHEHMPTYKLIKEYVERTGKMPPPKFMFRSIASDHLNEDDKYYTHHPDI